MELSKHVYICSPPYNTASTIQLHGFSDESIALLLLPSMKTFSFIKSETSIWINTASSIFPVKYCYFYLYLDKPRHKDITTKWHYVIAYSKINFLETKTSLALKQNQYNKRPKGPVTLTWFSQIHWALWGFF